MAHEISHVTARHGTKQATKGELIQLGAMAAMIVVPYGWAGYGIYQGMNLAIPLTFLKFSRDAEREADFLGIQYMYKAGYDPNAYVTFFERIQADEKRRPGTIPKFFSTHPPTPERIELAQKEIARILPDKDEYIVTTSEFDSVKGRLRNVMFAKKVQDNQPGKAYPAHQDRANRQAKERRPQRHCRRRLRRRPTHPQAPPRLSVEATFKPALTKEWAAVHFVGAGFTRPAFSGTNAKNPCSAGFSPALFLRMLP